MTGAGPGFADLKAEYDAVGVAGKDEFGTFDVGINPNIRLPAEAKAGTWVPEGMVTLGFGNDVWAGGANNVPYAQDLHLAGATVTLDDAVVVDKGALKL
jgi:hypothetical protein